MFNKAMEKPVTGRIIFIPVKKLNVSQYPKKIVIDAANN